MLNTFLRTVTGFFCEHEWMTRSDSTRVYVECVRCLSTSKGFEIEEKTRVVPRHSFHIGERDVSVGRVAA